MNETFQHSRLFFFFWCWGKKYQTMKCDTHLLLLMSRTEINYTADFQLDSHESIEKLNPKDNSKNTIKWAFAGIGCQYDCSNWIVMLWRGEINKNKKFHTHVKGKCEACNFFLAIHSNHFLSLQKVILFMLPNIKNVGENIRISRYNPIK